MKEEGMGGGMRIRWLDWMSKGTGDGSEIFVRLFKKYSGYTGFFLFHFSQVSWHADTFLRVASVTYLLCILFVFLQTCCNTFQHRNFNNIRDWYIKWYIVIFLFQKFNCWRGDEMSLLLHWKKSILSVYAPQASRFHSHLCNLDHDWIQN